MAFPDDRLGVVVEMAFGADLTADPSGWAWVDVGADLTDGEELERLFDQQIVITRGRADESARVQPTSVSVMLDNTDGHLTPQHPMSKWWPNVVKGTPLRISVPRPGGGIDYRFTGQVGSIEPEWEFGEPGGTDPGAVVTVAASGILRSLARRNSPSRSALFRHWTAPDVASVAYWPMEGGTDQLLISPTGAPPLSVSDAVEPGGAPMDLLPASEPLLAIPAGENGRWSATVPPFTVVDNEWCVAVAVYIDSAPPSGADQVLAVQADDLSSDNGVDATITVRPGDFQVTWRLNPVAGTVTQTFSSAAALGKWILIYASAQQSSIFGTDYKAGWVSISGAAGGAVTTYNDLGSARRPRVVGRSGTVRQDMAWGHLVVLSSPAASLPTATPTPYRAWTGETAVDRAERICSESGVSLTTPGRGIGADDLSMVMGVQRPGRLIDLLEEIAATDQGILGEQRSGLGLEYRTRQTLYNQIPAIELDAAADGISAPLAAVDDDQHLVNDVTVRNASTGGSRRVRDVSSIESQGQYDIEVSVSVESDLRLDDIAGWLVHLGTWPALRYPSLTVDLAVNPELIDTWLDLALGDRVTVDNLQDSHPPGRIDQLVQQVSERFSPFGWTVSVVGTPAGPWEVLVLGDDVRGRADTEGSELASSVTDSATTLTVATTSGPVWVDTAGHASQFPFDINVGGEIMTVTAISSTVSPQSFTVTRSTNGITKAHAAGTPVALAHSVVPAL